VHQAAQLLAYAVILRQLQRLHVVEVQLAWQAGTTQMQDYLSWFSGSSSACERIA
jgi:hypothetical protein